MLVGLRGRVEGHHRQMWARMAPDQEFGMGVNVSEPIGRSALLGVQGSYSRGWKLSGGGRPHPWSKRAIGNRSHTIGHRLCFAFEYVSLVSLIHREYCAHGLVEGKRFSTNQVLAARSSC